MGKVWKNQKNHWLRSGWDVQEDKNRWGEARLACNGKVALSECDAKSPVFMRLRTLLSRFDPGALGCDEGCRKKVTNYVLRGCVQRDGFDIFISVSERCCVVCTCGKKVNPRSS